jgi:hypothetical protein
MSDIMKAPTKGETKDAEAIAPVPVDGMGCFYYNILNNLFSNSGSMFQAIEINEHAGAKIYTFLFYFITLGFNMWETTVYTTLDKFYKNVKSKMGHLGLNLYLSLFRSLYCEHYSLPYSIRSLQNKFYFT